MNEENISIVSAFFSRISQFFNEFSWQDIKEVSLSSITSFNENYENILKPALNETI
nr:ABC transporter permease [Campylobacter jejuni]